MTLTIKRHDGDAAKLSQVIIPMQRARRIKLVEWSPDDSRMLLVTPQPGAEHELRALFADPEYDVKEI